MWTAVIVIFLAVAIAIAPLSLIAPSKSQRRIAKLRVYANQHGVQVRLTEAPAHAVIEEGESATVAQYILPWRPQKNSSQAHNDANKEEKSKKIRLQEWRLVKQKYQHDIHFCDAWNWSKGTTALAATQPFLREFLMHLPADAIAVEASPQGVSVYWREQAQLPQLENVLQQLRDLRSELEKAQGLNFDNGT